MEIIESHFKDKNFDIRLKVKDTDNLRFMDQKVTPDVLQFIADCVINLSSSSSQFSVADIWGSGYFTKNIESIFGKPSAKNKHTQNEYDKFIGQPLKMLAYAEILSENKIGNRNSYSVLNLKILEYISLKRMQALNFLREYTIKVLSDSDFYPKIKQYIIKVKKSHDETYFADLKNDFQNFMIGHTNTKTKREANRIFAKVLNPIAHNENIPGSIKGKMSKNILVFEDLMYNRPNFRDLGKAKGISRSEAQQNYVKATKKETVAHSDEVKAKELIREKYKESEVKDQWASGNASHVHHIFPRSDHPEFIAYTENLIKLTPEQHLNQAHINGVTTTIDKYYQIDCLIYKCFSIEESLENNENIYIKDKLIAMLNECLGLNLSIRDDFDLIRQKLRDYQINF